MDRSPCALPPEALRRRCDPARFDFETTADLAVLTSIIGQPRASAALELAIGIASHGFNLFALGVPGSGKTSLIRDYLQRRAAGQPVPADLCYVYNFADSRRPLPLLLPAGRAGELKKAVATLVTELREAIPKAFESAEYTSQREAIVHEVEEKRGAEFERLQAHVVEGGFQLVKAPGGLLLTPALHGVPLKEGALEQLTPEQRDKLLQVREKLERDVEAALKRVRDLERHAREALRTLETQTATFATQHLLGELRRSFEALPQVAAYLDALQADVVEHAADFLKERDGEAPPLPWMGGAGGEGRFVRYQVNVLVDNSTLHGAPVIVESNPTYHNLIGRIEHQGAWGTLVTDFTMLKAGALHQANGGYLILPARECLLSPYAWEGLKNALKGNVVRIEELGSQLSLVSAVSLEPVPVPLNVKVILIGSPALYYLLQAYDEDFQKLFKVKAEFTTEMERTPEAELAYATFANTMIRLEQGLPLDRGAVARLVEYGSRLVGDQAKLSTRFGEVADLIREAVHRARQGGQMLVGADAVRASEEARRYRRNLLEEHLQESVARRTLLVETRGAAVGRVNGLSVADLGDYAFGHPARITATVGPGRRGVVSVEREVELSGPIHGKGVLILGGYLTHLYGQTSPLSLTASLVFEQSYGMVEGDSASLAELYALLSALAGVALRQDIAVTGSVDQYGQVQPVGGLNEKIEGFFDACRAAGLTGSQGVLMPAANREHLMLRDDVVEAVRGGQFHVWTVSAVEEGLPLLTGLEAGQATDAGEYPDGTLNHAVAKRLAAFSHSLKPSPAPRTNGHALVAAREPEELSADGADATARR